MLTNACPGCPSLTAPKTLLRSILTYVSANPIGWLTSLDARSSGLAYTAGVVVSFVALGGLMLALFPSFLVLVGLASLGRPDASLAQLTVFISVPFMLIGAGSATGSLLIARRAERQAVAAGEDLADAGLTDTEKRELLGGGR